MQNIRLIWVGKSRQDFVRLGVEHYRERIKPFCRLELLEVRPAGHSGRGQAKSVGLESGALLKRLGERERVLLLDEGGRLLSSRELAGLLNQQGAEGGSSITFLLGGAHGVDERIKARADETLSLSRMTFPHQLARLILLEQLYRALTLNAGHAYHHD